MIELNLSQVYLFHLIHLSEETKKAIEEEREKSTRFVKAGTKYYPCVEFHIINDYFKDAPDWFPFNDFIATYAIFPKDDTYDIIVPLEDRYIGRLGDAEEQSIVSISKFNKAMKNRGKFENVSNYPYHPDITHYTSIKQFRSTAYNYPSIWNGVDESVMLHYLMNEIASNRRYIETEMYNEPKKFPVIRFKSNKAIRYFAYMYEHTPDDGDFADMYARNLLFKEISEKDVIFID